MAIVRRDPPNGGVKCRCGMHKSQRCQLLKIKNPNDCAFNLQIAYWEWLRLYCTPAKHQDEMYIQNTKQKHNRLFTSLKCQCSWFRWSQLSSCRLLGFHQQFCTRNLLITRVAVCSHGKLLDCWVILLMNNFITVTDVNWSYQKSAVPLCLFTLICY